MKIRNTIILIIIALLIGGYVYFYERRQLTTDEKKEKSGKVFAFKSENVTKLQIKKGEDVLLCSKKSKDNWEIEKPIQARADGAEIEKILSKLEFLKKERTIEEEKGKSLTMEEFGLKNAKFEVTVWVNDNVHTLLLGDDSPAGNNVFAGFKEWEPSPRGDKKSVFLVEKGMIDTLDKKVNDLRDRVLLTFEMDKVEKLQLRSNETTILCGKVDNYWHILGLDKIKAKESEISSLLWTLDGLRAKKFITDLPPFLSSTEDKGAAGEKGKEEEYGLAKPEFELTLYLKDNVTKSMLIGKEVSGEQAHYVRMADSGAVFLLDSDKVKDIKKDLNTLKEEPAKESKESESPESEESKDNTNVN